MTQEDPVWMQNQTYSARLDRQLIKAMFPTEGVLSGCAVSQRGAGANMSVDVAVGTGIIAGDDQTNQGHYMTTITAVENVVIGAAPGSNSRIDVVYWRINDPNAGGPAGDNSAFGVVAGVAAASPAVPATPTSAIALAQVLVAAGTVSITDAMITDVRAQALACGQVPPGATFDYTGTEAGVPSGYLLARGQTYDTSLYFGLYRVLGTNTLPDYRGRIGMGLDNMGGSDAGRYSGTNTLLGTGGEETHALTIAELAVHDHAQAAHSHTVAAHVHTIDHDHPSGTTGVGSPHSHTNDHDHGSATTDSGGSHQHTAKVKNVDMISAGVYSLTRIESASSWYDAYQTITPAGEGAHTHTYDLPAYTGTTGSETTHTHAFDVAAYTGNSGSATSTTDTSGATTVGSTGSGTAHNNLQPFILVNKIIKT